MTKPREFWIVETDYSLDIRYSCPSSEAELAQNWIHVREVVDESLPLIDWDRIAQVFYGSDNSNVRRKQLVAIQQLVERALKGEL